MPLYIQNGSELLEEFDYKRIESDPLIKVEYLLLKLLFSLLLNILD